MSAYKTAEPISEAIQKELEAHPMFVQQLLFNRGIHTKEAAAIFLSPDYDRDLNDPFLMTDMDIAVDRVLVAIEKNERIIIYSDYDCDGIPGGVLLHDFFSKIGYANFTNYIPHRHEEGYGFNVEAVEKLKEDNAHLIITVDCGIVDVAATKKANDLEIDVIITDHHELGKELPPALAILNPKRDDAYPFQGLCGSGVAYKLVQALIQKGKEKEMPHFEALKDGWEKWWLDVVGIATVADMVPLTGENRALAHYGLQVLRKSKRPGLQHLLRKMRVNQRTITEDDIGFMIGPRINAASRMDTPEDAFHVLATTDEAIAGTHALHLEKLNNERKGVVASMTKEVKKRIAKSDEIKEVLVMGNPKWRPSLVGLVANSVAEEYKRPTFIWGRDGRGVLKGSCRSDGIVSVVDLMKEIDDALIEFGGHHAAGGFAVVDASIHTLEARLVTAYQEFAREQKHIEVMHNIDLELTLEDVTEEIVRHLDTLAPFGVANEKPLFLFKDVRPKTVDVFGKTKEHTKLVFDSFGGALEAIAFFKKPDQFGMPLQNGKPISLIAHIEKSFFMNRPQIRLRIVDVV